MLGWHRKTRLLGVGVLARAAGTLAALGVTLVTLNSGAFGSNSVRGHERSVDIVYALSIGPDGKLVVAGTSGSSTTGSEGNWALARYTPRGRLDVGFGTAGRVLTNFRTGGGEANAVAVQADGKPVLAGALSTGYVLPSGDFPTVFALARYGRRGKLDRRFGKDGLVLTRFGRRRDWSIANGLAVQKDGKLVAIGLFSSLRYDDFALARYTARGLLDRSFGRAGKVLTSFGAHTRADASAVAIQPDGKIVVAGTDLTDTRPGVGVYEFALARYNADGTLDRGFGDSGRVVTKAGPVSNAYAVVVQPDGKLFAAGSSAAGDDAIHGKGNLILVRYSSAGKLDPNFGTGGELEAEAGVPAALAIQADRKLVTAGVGIGPTHRDDPRDFALARYTESGSLDPSFGGGTLLTDFRAGARAVALVVDGEGRIVAAGTVRTEDFALARYTTSGGLDRSFGTDGKVVTDFELLRRAGRVSRGP